MASGESVIHFALPKGQGRTIKIREKYGPVTVLDNVNMLVEYQGQLHVTVGGNKHGVFPLSNYAWERDDEDKKGAK